MQIGVAKLKSIGLWWQNVVSIETWNGKPKCSENIIFGF